LRPTRVFPKNYFNQVSFKKKFGVDFEEVLMNYLNLYAQKYNLETSFDDNLISLNHLMKILIKNRDKDSENYNILDEFVSSCNTPHTKHMKEQKINPFIVLEVGLSKKLVNFVFYSYQSPIEPTYTYVSISNFVFNRRYGEYQIYFRY